MEEINYSRPKLKEEGRGTGDRGRRGKGKGKGKGKVLNLLVKIRPIKSQLKII